MKKPAEPKKELRKQAEDKVARLRDRDLLRYLPQYEEKRLVHELQVHQVELEMQNEEMRHTQLELEQSRSRYKELYDYAPVGYLTLDKAGLIVEANLTAATLLTVSRAALLFKHLQSFMDRESADALHIFLRKPLPPGMKEILDCRLLTTEGTPFEISLNVGGEYDRSARLMRYRVVLVDVNRLKLMERQARETGDRLRSLASELNLSEERTRQAIAQTLHDEIGQLLALARMKLSSALTLSKQTAADKIVDEVLDMLALVIKETRALMVEISPPVLHDLGLGAAIDWMAERMSSEHGIAIETVNMGDCSDLEQDLKVMLYQMTRELLINIVKHSGGRHVVLTFERDDHTLGIKAMDDGKGFDASRAGSSTADSGFGLFSIRERLKSYNGSLQIESQKGKGTTVSIRMPVGKRGES
jgi:two-component system, NarL family, sensor histidine kinase UhpB